MSNSPIFVCGALRSGTTLLRLMIDSHPLLKNPGEFDYLIEYISNEGPLPTASQYKKSLETNRIFRMHQLEIRAELSNYPDIVNDFVRQLSETDKRILLNVHRNFHRIPDVFPDAKYIHMIRDPRDVARSSIAMGWAGNLYYGVDHWIETEKSWDKLKKKLTDEQYLEFRFEDLIVEPENILTKLSTFCDTEYSDMMMNYAGDSTYKRPDPSLIFQWKEKLDSKTAASITEKTEKWVKQYGYEYVPQDKKLSLLDKVKFFTSNKLFKIRFKQKRFGVRLIFLNKIASMFKLEKMSHKVKLEINEIENKHLK